MNTYQSSDFPTATQADWRAQIRRELKADRDQDALRWQLPDGFSLDAYYTADDLAQLPLDATQSVQQQQPGWLNTPKYGVDGQVAEQNEALRSALATGADALCLAVPAGWPKEQLSRLLHGIKLSETPVFFQLTDHVVSFVETLKTVAPYRLKGGLLVGSDVSTADLATVTQLTADSPQFRTVGISSHDFHNAGATATQELAFLLARLNERSTALTKAGLAPDVLVPKIALSVSVGTSYFVEIAKLRALRVLLSKQLSVTSEQMPLVHCQTSTFYDAAATPYTNLLRATTEAMAATIGGCDALTVQPFDAVLATSADPEFSQRIARNVALLLADEAYMSNVADPAKGSYYVETLTHQLTQAARLLFERVQEMGGLTAAFSTGFVQAEIDRSYQERVDAVKNGRMLVGVTKYRHAEAEIGQPEKSPADPLNGTLPDTTSLPNRRIAQPFE